MSGQVIFLGYAHLWRLSFPVYQPENQPPVVSLVVPPGGVTHAVAAGSQLLKTPDLAYLEPAQKVVIQANYPCNGIGCGACGGAAQVSTGRWTCPGNVAGPLRSKFVLGHEIGHALQDLADAMPGYDYATGPSTDAFCRCDHVNPAFYKDHCLQSAESSTAGQAEGFAHFSAAKFWNSASENDCVFMYYKQFRDPTEPVMYQLKNPPNKHSCRNPRKWRNLECDDKSPAWGTEYDWMQFFWNVNTVGANTSTVPDLFAIYRLACGGACQVSPPETPWPQLMSGAEVHHGPGSDQASWFSEVGQTTGVDQNL